MFNLLPCFLIASQVATELPWQPAHISRSTASPIEASSTASTRAQWILLLLFWSDYRTMKNQNNPLWKEPVSPPGKSSSLLLTKHLQRKKSLFFSPKVHQFKVAPVLCQTCFKIPGKDHKGFPWVRRLKNKCLKFRVISTNIFTM